MQVDFHGNNILIDLQDKKLTFIDLGEVVITHPFFSAFHFLSQAIKHYKLTKANQHYQKLIQVCEKHWPEFQKILPSVEIIYPLYTALGCYRLMKSIDIDAYYQFYNHHKLADNLRNYLKTVY